MFIEVVLITTFTAKELAPGQDQEPHRHPMVQAEFLSTRQGSAQTLSALVASGFALSGYVITLKAPLTL